MPWLLAPFLQLQSQHWQAPDLLSCLPLLFIRTLAITSSPRAILADLPIEGPSRNHSCKVSLAI